MATAIGDSPQTAEAVRRGLKDLQSQGYQSTALTPDANGAGTRLENGAGFFLMIRTKNGASTIHQILSSSPGIRFDGDDKYSL